MMNNEHGGNIRKLAKASARSEKEILDFSANINPLGPPEWLRPLISSRLSSLVHYPDPECSLLRSSIASHYGVTEDEILAGSGSSEIIHLLARTLPFPRALILAPSYSDYVNASELAGKAVERVFLKEEEAFQLDLSLLDSKIRDDQLVFIGQPNNPTGLLVDPFALRILVSKHPSAIFVIDEAFLDFVEEAESLICNRPPNVIILRSFTKFFAIPGLRLGFAIAEPDLVRKAMKMMPPWSVNSLAQVVGEKAFQDHAYATETRTFIRNQRELLLNELKSFSGLTVFPGKANFLLIRIDRKDMDARNLAAQMLASGIAVRVCDNFEGLDVRFFRIAVRSEDENEKLLSSLRRVLEVSAKPRSYKKTSAIMFQGTGSNAGKSVLAAAMCRILLQDGYRVAPFKAQNMSLNSFVTREGGEMGRAQVVQAQACRIDPDVRMNPILLKPNSDTGSQVILNGKPVGNMDVAQYIQYKPVAFEAAKRDFDSLSKEFDVIVLEGAGSPAEVNLKHHDIVNMKMATYAEAPVLLVGDIDRGGVFASFVGTMEVLAEWERKLIAGLVINRFRGKEDLLGPAIESTAYHTGVPFLGIVPYLHNLGLPEEDSVGFKSGAFDLPPPRGSSIEIAVIDLPHLSNFTDFDSLRIEPDVFVHIVRSPKDLDHPDAVILPGSKNVIGDLDYIRQSGLDRKIIALTENGGTEVVGICGGFQILGEQIDDPYGIESPKQMIHGLGLLPIYTVMARTKTLVRADGIHLPSGLNVRGYEIHHGQTEGKPIIPLLLRKDGEVIGAGTEDKRIWGTYLHGIFDADEFRRWFIDRLRTRRNLPAIGKVSAVYDLEPAFERLAETVRRSLKIGEIYQLMGLK